MTEKELKKLNRSELLEILVAQGEKIETLEQQLADAQKALQDRRIEISSCGSIAEAALKLNHIFEDAESAAAQYLESVRLQEKTAGRIISDAEDRAAQILKDAELQSEARKEQTEREIENRLLRFQEQFKSYLRRCNACWLRDRKPGIKKVL